jgi:Family of unknown function (DUF5995)
MQTYTPATTLDEVITQLTVTIERARREQSRLGYFPALYRLVTIKVKEGIQQGRFEDGPRMERLDVAFANRYLAALESYQQKQPLSECWRVAFDAASAWRRLILQHLLLGMNAHINFDLGIAAAEISTGSDIAKLQRDFNEINVILASLINQVQDAIESLSPWIKLLDTIGGRTDETIVHFSLNIARSQAWRLAQKLAATPVNQWQPDLTRIDRDIATLGRLIQRPGWALSTGMLVIRMRESSDVGKVIDVMSRLA